MVRLGRSMLFLQQTMANSKADLKRNSEKESYAVRRLLNSPLRVNQPRTETIQELIEKQSEKQKESIERTLAESFYEG